MPQSSIHPRPDGQGTPTQSIVISSTQRSSLSATSSNITIEGLDFEGKVPLVRKSSTSPNITIEGLDFESKVPLIRKSSTKAWVEFEEMPSPTRAQERKKKDHLHLLVGWWCIINHFISSM